MRRRHRVPDTLRHEGWGLPAQRGFVPAWRAVLGRGMGSLANHGAGVGSGSGADTAEGPPLRRRHVMGH